MSVIEQILNHRSIRKYKPDPIPEDVLQEILQAGIRTSSSGNMQTYSIIITRDLQLRERLLEPHMGQKMVVDAPVFLTFCADFNRMRRWLKLSQAADNFDNFFSFLIGAIDAILVSQSVALSAESRGLGLCYLGSTLANGSEIGEILKLPKNVVPVTGFSVGYPDEQPDLRDRLPLSGLVHWETYHDYTDQDIHEIYNEREVKGWQRYMRSKWLREQIDEKEIENLAQLYTEVKYTRSSHQDYSRKVLAYLEEQEFMLNDET